MLLGAVFMAVPIKMPRAARKELLALGKNTRVARLRRKLTAEIVAQRAGTTRQTIAKIESGNPAVKIGTYVAVLQVDLSRFDAAPLIAFIAAKETSFANETDGRIPR